MAYDRPDIVSGVTRLDKPFVENIFDGIDEKLSEADANATYATPASVETQVPPIVVDLLSAEPTVVAAAASAVDDELAARDLVEGDDPRIFATEEAADALFGVKDESGREAFVARTDGTTDIALPNLAGAKFRAVESTKYLAGTQDASGRIAEDAIDLDGMVPQWILDRWKERMDIIPEVALPRFHVIVAAGQSNSSTSDVTPPTGLYETDPRLWKWDRGTSAIVPMPATEAYLLPSFAREYIKSAPSDVHVLVVPCGYGETGFRSTSLVTPPAGYEAAPNGTWDRTLTSDTNNLYARMVADVAAARAAAAAVSSSTPKVAALLWSQGENDTDMMTQSEYAAALDDLIATFRTDTGLAALPVVVGSMVPEYVAAGSSIHQAIQNALIDTPRRVLNTAFVYGPKGMVRSDQVSMIHWSTTGQIVRGKLFRQGLDRALWNFTAAKAIPPQNLTAVRSGTTLHAQWEPSPTRATAYVVEVSDDDGATWDPLTLVGGAIGLEGTATVPATGALLVRASTTNETNTSPYITLAI